MKLTGLEPLYRSMREKGKNVDKFFFQDGRGKFEVLFYIDSEPFILGFSAKGASIYFELNVLRGFKIDTMLPKEDLNALRKALGIEYAVGGEPFSTNKFFEDFNGKIPKSVTTSKDISPDEIATYRRDVEESNKKYFVGWRDNGKCNKRVTKHNLHKTKRLLGEKAYRIADKANYSSCWSDNKAKAIEYRLP